MESSNEDSNSGGKRGRDCNGMKWTHIRNFQHRYIINVPTREKKSVPVDIQLPVPLFDPLPIIDYYEYNKLFNLKRKPDTRLAFYRKLYSKANKKILRQGVQEHEFTNLPQYVIDVAQGVFQNDFQDSARDFTGGTLDLLNLSNDEFVVSAGLRQSLQVTNLNLPSVNSEIRLSEESPVYNIKSKIHSNCACIAVRQKCKISLFKLSSDGLQSSHIWKARTVNSSFTDMAFNDLKDNELAIVDNTHKLKIKNFLTKDTVAQYDFPTESADTNDFFAQVHYIDCNTLGFINRCCVYLLDLRSLSAQKTCLRNTWLKCDDLCTFTKASELLCISSLHNVINYDMRLMKEIDRTLHMLSTPPFISSFIDNTGKGIVCLSGQRCNDKAILCSSSGILSTPQYVPYTKDAFVKTCLTNRIDNSQQLIERLSVPTIGMKLHKSSRSADINLYTVNSVGDVFKQSLLQKELNSNNEAINKLAEWSAKIICKPKALEATSLCNLSNIMDAISHQFPQENNLKNLMKENAMLPKLENEYLSLTNYLKSNVGESMNAIWDDEKPIAEETVDLASEIPSKRKVSEWLDSVS